MKYYILMQRGWDYDDEYYNPTEKGSGHPKKVFTDLKEAQEALDKAEKDHFADLQIQDDLYNENWCLEDYSDFSEEITKEIKSKIKTDKQYFKDLEPFQQNIILEICRKHYLWFYEIVTVEQ